MNKKLFKFVPVSLTALLLLVGCKGSLINRTQAIQSLKLIESKLQSIKESGNTFTQLYIELIKTHVESHIEIKEVELFELSFSSKVAHYSYTKSRSESEVITNQINNQYFMRDGNYYCSEFSLTTKTDGTSDVSLERTGTKNKDKAITSFNEKYSTLYTNASNLLEQYDNVSSKVDLITSFSTMETPRIIKDRYHSKGNGHIVAEINRYTSTSRRTLSQVTYFLYDKYLLNDYSFTDYKLDTNTSLTIRYTLNIVAPEPFDIPDDQGTSETSEPTTSE